LFFTDSGRLIGNGTAGEQAAVNVRGLITFGQALPADGRRHSVLHAVLLDDYQELLVQRVATASSRLRQSHMYLN